MTNNYFCRQCGSPAKKTPLVRLPKDDPEHGCGTLGSWRCTGRCKGKVPVRRERRGSSREVAA